MLVLPASDLFSFFFTLHGVNSPTPGLLATPALHTRLLKNYHNSVDRIANSYSQSESVDGLPLVFYVLCICLFI